MDKTEWSSVSYAMNNDELSKLNRCHPSIDSSAFTEILILKIYHCLDFSGFKKMDRQLNIIWTFTYFVSTITQIWYP